MAKIRLSKKLLEKLAKKTKHEVQYIRERISKQADRDSIASEAVLVLWAKRLGFRTVAYQRTLPAYIQEQIRTSLPSVFTSSASRDGSKKTGITKKIILERSGRAIYRKSPLSSTIDYLIQDQELRDRCKDLLRAKGNFDRVFREATTILDNRIKKISGVGRMRPIDAIGKALNPNPNSAVLKMSDEKFEQEGFFNICKGLMLAFRDTTHHELSDKFSREEALKFCGFVDIILAMLNKAKRK